uniref:DegT/DnrJ/EryC1/StrS aminotransferase family protein n=1 Tax=Macrostomum lignano TaxID=282301 RepID=A0A1I8F7G8_9PLAT
MDDEGVAMLEAAKRRQKTEFVHLPSDCFTARYRPITRATMGFRDGVHANGAESAARHCGLDRPGHYCLPVPNVTNMVWIGLQCVR